MWKIAIPSAAQRETAASGPKGYLYPVGTDKDSSRRGKKLRTHFHCNVVCDAWTREHAAKAITSHVGKQGRAEGIMTGNSRVFTVMPDGGVDAWFNHDTNAGSVNTQICRDLVDYGGVTTPVGTLPTGASHYGCYEMAGNAHICRALRAMTASASRAVLPPTMS